MKYAAISLYSVSLATASWAFGVICVVHQVAPDWVIIAVL